MALGDIILLQDQTPRGPYTRAQIQEGLGRGDFNGQILAHTPGLKDWLPLSEVLHHLDHDVVKPTRLMSGRSLPPLPGTGNVEAPPVLPPMPMEEKVPPALPKKENPAPPPLAEAVSARRESELIPAPIRPRFIAWVIDCVVLFAPIFVLGAVAYSFSFVQGSVEHKDAETLRQEHLLLWRNLQDLVFMVALGFGWLYGAGLESSHWQATIGKQWMGIKVTDSLGGRLGFLQATGRHAAKYLSALPCFVGFMAALFSSRHLAWHDRLAETRVVLK